MIGDNSAHLNISNFNNPDTLKIGLKEPKGKRKSLAEKLEKDSMAGRRSSREIKISTPNVYKGKKIGNFRVICKGKCVLPPQYHYTVCTFTFTLSLVSFQIFYNN